MPGLIILIIVVFAIVLIAVCVKFSKLLFVDASAFFCDLKNMDEKAIRNELKKFALFFGSLMAVFAVIIFICFCAVFYQIYRETIRTTLPDYVPEQTIFSESYDFRDEVKELIERKENESGFPKFISSRYLDVSFWENLVNETNRFHEIIDLNRGLRVAGYIEYISNPKMSRASKYINAKPLILNESPVFIVQRNETRLIKGGLPFKYNDWRNGNDYWLIQPQKLPINIDSQIAPSYFPDRFDVNYILPFENGLKLFTLQENGYVEKTVWKNGDGFDLSGINKNNYRISAISDNVFLLLIQGDFHWYFLISSENGSKVRKFDLEELDSIAPKEFLDTYRKKKNDSGFLIGPEIYSNDGEGKLLLKFLFYGNDVLEFDLNQLDDGRLSDVLHYLGPHSNEFFVVAAVHGNQKIIFQKRSNTDEIKTSNAHKVWEADHFYMSERNSDGSLGEMKQLNWSALLTITNDRLRVLFPPDLNEKVVVFYDSEFWTMNLDGSGLKKVFPRDDVNE